MGLATSSSFFKFSLNGNQELSNCQCIFRPDGETTSDRDYCSFFQGESEQQLVKKYDSYGRSNPYFGAFLIAMKSPVQHEASPVNSDSKKNGHYPSSFYSG